eukprot:6175361-Pleurochrysis_carterae.AAC.4
MRTGDADDGPDSSAVRYNLASNVSEYQQSYLETSLMNPNTRLDDPPFPRVVRRAVASLRMRARARDVRYVGSFVQALRASSFGNALGTHGECYNGGRARTLAHDTCTVCMLMMLALLARGSCAPYMHKALAGLACINRFLHALDVTFHKVPAHAAREHPYLRLPTDNGMLHSRARY